MEDYIKLGLRYSYFNRIILQIVLLIVLFPLFYKQSTISCILYRDECFSAYSSYFRTTLKMAMVSCEIVSMDIKCLNIFT